MSKQAVGFQFTCDGEGCGLVKRGWYNPPHGWLTVGETFHFCTICKKDERLQGAVRAARKEQSDEPRDRCCRFGGSAMNGRLSIFRNGRLMTVLNPLYDDGPVAREARALDRHNAKMERRKMRFILLDTMRMCAERNEPYLIDGSMTLSDGLWRTYAELIHEDACYEAVAPCGSTQLILTRRGLAILDSIIRDGGKF